MVEIERKFILSTAQAKQAIETAVGSDRIRQGYLSFDPERTVRVRLRGNQGELTIKGASSADGLSRFEWNQPIEPSDAQALLSLCTGNLIEKMRYYVPFDGQKFEVDVFYGVHEGLIIAELELESENQRIHFPHWIGHEVTGQREYYNSYLSAHNLHNG